MRSLFYYIKILFADLLDIIPELEYNFNNLLLKGVIMNLALNMDLAIVYHSQSQKIRVITECWVKDNMYCPRCGCSSIAHANNNMPVKDFYCSNCGNEYELKSKSGSFSKKIGDDAYSTMIERITSNNNPDFFLMSYNKKDYTVTDFSLIPKYFFVPEIIEKRRPLSQTARRAGWVGCNILIERIPEQGKINIIKNGVSNDKQKVIDKLKRSAKLSVDDIKNRGWLFDVLNCVNMVQSTYFTLGDIYSFEQQLSIKHPENNNVKAKIRQQLQLLRDKGFIIFLGNGKYAKII